MEGINLHDLLASYGSDKCLIAFLARKLYSIYERAPPVNISGRCGRKPISPANRRFTLIVDSTRQLIHPNDHGKDRKKYLRNVIDQTNRNYRQDLRVRKVLLKENNKENVSASDDDNNNED